MALRVQGNPGDGGERGRSDLPTASINTQQLANETSGIVGGLSGTMENSTDPTSAGLNRPIKPRSTFVAP